MSAKAGGSGAAHDPTIAAVDGTGRRSALLREIEACRAKVERQKAHLAGATTPEKQERQREHLAAAEVALALAEQKGLA